MEQFKRIWKVGKAANDLHGFLTSELVKRWLVPTAAATVTMLSAFLTAVPAPYLLTGAFVSAAAVATLLLRVDEWRERTSPSGRLTVAGLFIGPEIAAEQASPILKTAQLSLLLKNNASFPLHYEVESFEAQIMGRVTTEPQQASRPAEIPPGDTALYRDYVIDVQAPLLKEYETGRLRFKVAYWKSPRRRYHLERSLRLHLRRDPASGHLGLTSAVE